MIQTNAIKNEAAPHKQARILVMEDEPSVAKGLQMVLKEEGYGVDVAMTGRKALDVINEKVFDLLLADLRLPDIDGMEVIKKVKSKKPDTGVIVITGYSTVSSAVEAMKLGVSDYLPKPFMEEELKKAVHDALKERETPQEAPEEAGMVAEEASLIQQREVIGVLNRTSEDPEFWRELMERGSEALEEYDLTMEAKGAIASGDLKWINENVGELTQKQLRFINKRLEREAW
ncbi:MAG: response regulator [Deltaproteobacteria bacterium]|nr:response regulator [Deltaproteobacteria bacterium]MBW1815793.1 response regulator [Deltaproteobacteria bacterium]